MSKKKIKNESEKENGIMNFKIIKVVLEIFSKIVDLTNKVIDAGDPEKYVKSVQELNKGVSETYAEMRDIISNDPKMSSEEKLKKLQELAECEERAKEKCGEAIIGNRENVAKITLEVLKGLLTCGVSFTPAIARGIKNALSKSNANIELENELLVEIDDSSVEALPENCD